MSKRTNLLLNNLPVLQKNVLNILKRETCPKYKKDDKLFIYMICEDFCRNKKVILNARRKRVA